MSLGTAVAILALVVLYWITRDRWNWLKIWKWIGAVLAVLIAVGGIGGGAIYWYDNQPQVAESYWNLSLGDEVADVRFFKGLPDTVWVGDSDDSLDSTYVYTKASSYDKGPYYVSFAYGRVNQVICESDCPGLQGIHDYSGQHSIRDRFGEPEKVRSSEDGLFRYWWYPKYRVRFMLEKGQIAFYGIYLPK